MEQDRIEITRFPFSLRLSGDQDLWGTRVYLIKVRTVPVRNVPLRDSPMCLFDFKWREEKMDFREEKERSSVSSAVTVEIISQRWAWLHPLRASQSGF